MPHPAERELTAHLAALRALARDLVGESHADDVVQETAIEALRRPPSAAGPMLGWLRLVVRRLAGRHRRAARRRAARELAVAREEVVPAHDELEHRETLQRLTAAVLALPEPYQRTLLLRYLEGLPPNAIAQRTLEPVATVKSRLQRGLALLRTRFDEDDVRGRPGWRAAFAAACGLDRGAAAAAGAALTTITGAILMGTGTKAMFGGAAALAAALAVFWLAGRGTPDREPIAAAGQRPAAAVATAASQRAASADAAPVANREAIDAPAVPLPPSPALAVVRGRCVDEAGRPVAGMETTIRSRAPSRTPGSELEDWQAPPPQTIGADGRFEFAFAPPARSVELSLFDRRTEGTRLGGYLRWPRLEPGQRVDLGDVPTFACCELRLRVVDTLGAPQMRLSISVSRTSAPESPLDVSFGGGGATDAAGRRILERLTAGTFIVSAQEREVVRGDRFTIPAGATTFEHEVVVRAIGPEDLLRGLVVDETGLPLWNVRVDGIVGSEREAVHATTRRDGTFELVRQQRHGEGEVTLSVTESGFEELLPEERFAWGRDDVRLVLRRWRTIEVVAQAPDGTPVEDYAVWVVKRQDAFRSFEAQDIELRADGRHEHGVATVAGIPRGPHFVIVEPDDAALATSRPVPIDVGDAPVRVLVRLRPAPRRFVRVLRADGSPAVDAEVLLLDPAGLESCVPGNAVPMHEWAYYTQNGARLAQSPLPILLQRARTDDRGEAKLRGCDEAPATVAVRGQDHAPLQREGIDPGAAEPLVLTLATDARLTGRADPAVLGALRELRGLPASGPVGPRQQDDLPWLRLARGEANHPETVPPPPGRNWFADDGSFAFEHVPPGTWQLQLTGHTATTQVLHETIATLELREGEARDLPLELGALLPCELSGVVHWNGEPLANGSRTLQVVGTDLAGAATTWHSTVRTDAEGRYRWRGRAGTATLHEFMAAVAEETVALRPGARLVQDFHGSSGELRLRLVDDAGRPVADVGFDLVDGGGRSDFPLPPTDAEGRSRRRLPTGTYRAITLAKDAPALHGIDLGVVTVTPAQDAEIELRLPARQRR